MKSSAVLLAVVAVLGASTLTRAQTARSNENNRMSTYNVIVVNRTTRAVKYEHRHGSTKIDFEGTSLMPGGSGEAKIESNRGAMKIDAEFSGLRVVGLLRMG